MRVIPGAALPEESLDQDIIEVTASGSFTLDGTVFSTTHLSQLVTVFLTLTGAGTYSLSNVRPGNFIGQRLQVINLYGNTPSAKLVNSTNVDVAADFTIAPNQSFTLVYKTGGWILASYSV